MSGLLPSGAFAGIIFDQSIDLTSLLARAGLEKSGSKSRSRREDRYDPTDHRAGQIKDPNAPI
jgi:hypothetical protein